MGTEQARRQRQDRGHGRNGEADRDRGVRGDATDRRRRRTRLVAVGVGVSALIAGTGACAKTDSASTAGGKAIQAPAPDAYAGNLYRNPGINAWVTTADDPASAFSADVDTGSYTVGRRYVDDGNRPNPDSVRLEEYVNYFDQGYDAPAAGTTFGLHADGAATPFLPAGSNQRLVRLGVRARDAVAETRKPANLVFVIDVSGSMEGERLGLAQTALRMVVDELSTGDSVGIVTFANEATLVLPATPASDRRTILSAIDSLVVQGGTNAEAGLKLGYQEAQRARIPDGINRVILASDGMANVGTTGPDTLAAQVRTSAQKGVQLVTLGVGMGGYNDVLMEQLADKGDGFYAYIDDEDEAARLLRTKLLSTIEPVALDANIGVVWDTALVLRYRLLGFENRVIPDSQVNAPAMDGGDVNAGHTVTALYHVELAPGVEVDPDAQLGMFGIRWVDPTTKAVDGLVHPVRAGDLAASWEAASPRLRLDATVAQYAEVLRNSPYVTGATIADVARVAGSLPRELPDDLDVAEFADLTRRASGTA